MFLVEGYRREFIAMGSWTDLESVLPSVHSPRETPINLDDILSELNL